MIEMIQRPRIETEELMMRNMLPPGKSVLPIELLKRVSPEKSTCSASQ